MIKRFKKDTVYSGELIFGGCGGLERNKVTLWGDRGKSSFDYGLREGCDTA